MRDLLKERVMKRLAILLGAGALAIGLSGCVSDGYYGSDLGYGYGPSYYGAAPAYGYGVDASAYARTCVRRERVWDRYQRRMVTVRRSYPC